VWRRCFVVVVPVNFPFPFELRFVFVRLVRPFESFVFFFLLFLFE